MDGIVTYRDPNVRCESCAKFAKQCAVDDPTAQVADCPEYVVKITPLPNIPKPDMVNHPSHYTQGGIECIKAIEASMTPKGFQDYCKGNVLKYIWRWRDKAGIEDLKKAQVYLGWLIESVQKEKIRGEADATNM